VDGWSVVVVSVGCWWVGGSDAVLLDPALWEAAGRSLGTNLPEMRCDGPRCDTVQCEYGGYVDPKSQMLGLIEWLWAHPGDVDGYLAQITGNAKTE